MSSKKRRLKFAAGQRWRTRGGEVVTVREIRITGLSVFNRAWKAVADANLVICLTDAGERFSVASWNGREIPWKISDRDLLTICRT